MNVSRRQLMRATLALASMALAGCTSTRQQNSATVFCFNTVCTIAGDMSQGTLDEVCSLCERFESLLSRTIETSDVGRINAARGESVKVDSATADVIRKALKYCKESDGLFDITIGAVSELWDFVEGIVPSEESIARALPHVGWKNVRVDGDNVCLSDPDARIDLGGIAKGYIADAVADLLHDRGVKSATINLGGNVVVLGTKAGGDPWSIGVRDPTDDSGASICAKIRSAGGSLVTSGLYERSFERDGQTYWHILDPRTGYPVETDVMSASIYSQRSIDGDGYTKPLFFMSTEKALAWLAERPELQALIVKTDGSIVATPNSAFEF